MEIVVNPVVGIALNYTVLAYVAGYIIKKIWPKYKSCNVCKANIHSSVSDISAPHHFFTAAKEYGGVVAHRLQYISAILYASMEKLYVAIRGLLPQVIFKKGFFHFIIKYCFSNIDFKFNDCEHKTTLIKHIIECFAKILTYNYLKDINNILDGKYRRDILLSEDKVFHDAKVLADKSRKRI